MSYLIILLHCFQMSQPTKSYLNNISDAIQILVLLIVLIELFLSFKLLLNIDLAVLISFFFKQSRSSCFTCHVLLYHHTSYTGLIKPTFYIDRRQIILTLPVHFHISNEI